MSARRGIVVYVVGVIGLAVLIGVVAQFRRVPGFMPVMVDELADEEAAVAPPASGG